MNLPEYRISPINYVIQRRMTEAKWSLTNTELSQAEISWRVGYENVDHFAKLFLRHVGCSPRITVENLKTVLRNNKSILISLTGKLCWIKSGGAVC